MEQRTRAGAVRVHKHVEMKLKFVIEHTTRKVLTIDERNPVDFAKRLDDTIDGLNINNPTLVYIHAPNGDLVDSREIEKHSKYFGNES